MIRREIVLPARREDVWEALTDPERLADWFANDVDGTRLTVVETAPAWTTALDLQASALAVA